MEHDRDQIRLVEALRSYLAARAHAGDGLDGIIRWWLPGFEPLPEPEAVIRALRQLESEGWVTQRLVAAQPWWRSTGRSGGQP